MMELLEDVLSAVVGAEKSLEYTKRILILSPMYMIVAIIGWVKKSNSVTRDTLNVINAIMKSPSEYLATSTQ